jgi:hypothetical protein
LHKIDGHGKIWSRKWLAPTGAKPKGNDDDDDDYHLVWLSQSTWQSNFFTKNDHEKVLYDW